MRRLILVLSLVLALVAGAPAQQATAGTFGYGCPSPPSETTLSYVGLPQLGGTFTVTYRGPTSMPLSSTTSVGPPSRARFEGSSWTRTPWPSSVAGPCDPLEQAW